MATQQEEVGEPSSLRYTYHAFLSFRGDDIRYDFGDWLYHALLDAGVYTFRDDDDINKGKKFDPEIRKAIDETKVAVIVFSRDFASSSYCLDEVAMFMDRRRRGEVEVLPVFYKVDPDDVWAIKGTYAKSFRRHRLKLKSCQGKELEEKKKNLEDWRDALREVAEVTGYHVYTKRRYQSEFIRKIVEDARRLANPVTLDIPSHVVGQPYRFLGLEKWVQDGLHDRRVALLHGAYGIGKKTIAAVVSSQNYKDFDATAFLDKIAEKSKQPDGIAKLQSQLLSRLRKPKGNGEVLSELEGKAGIKEGLKNKRVLIVLADLDQSEQFFSLIQDLDCLEQGSKVIVTSESENLLADRFAVKFRVGSLTPAHSLELFSWHAFGTTRAIEECEGRVMAALRYCCGIPTVLKAYASFLSSLSMDQWDELLPGTNEDLKLSIYRKNDLKSSFDSLENDDKKLFYDIACFYAGRDHDHVKSVVSNRNLYKAGGFDRLRRKNLVSVDANNKVAMDQPIIELGRDIVRQKTDFVEECSNIWSPEDAFQLLRKCNGTKHVRSFILDRKQVETYSTAEMEFKTEAFAGMTELKLLQLVDIKLKGDYRAFPKDLVWLSWEGFSLKRLPDNISSENLVILDLQNSSLERLWNGSRSLGKLKLLNLSHSQLLQTTPDFELLHVPTLERLILEDCICLVKIHPSIGVLPSLVQLRLKGCVSLEEVPALGSPVELDISGCTGLRAMPDQAVGSVKELRADQIAVDQLRSGLTTSFSFSAVFPSLVKLSLVSCKLSDENIVSDLVELRGLEDLDLSRNLFSAMPETLGAFSSLRTLSLEECERLQVVRKLPSGLKKLSLVNCKSLKRIDGVVRPGMNLFAVGCENLVQVGEASRSEAMKMEDIEAINDLKLYNWDCSTTSYDIEMANTRTGLNKRTPLQEQQVLFHCGIFNCFVRGSTVPEWYEHQTEEDSILCLVQPEPGRRIIGINLCVVYKTKEHYTSFPIYVVLSLINNSKDLFWEYSPLAYARGDEEDMMWLSHWKLMDQIEPGDGLSIHVSSPTDVVDVTRFGICLAYERKEDQGKQPIATSTWYRKLDADLSAYKTSQGHFDLVNQSHRCVMSTGYWFGGEFFLNIPRLKPPPLFGSRQRPIRLN